MELYLSCKQQFEVKSILLMDMFILKVKFTHVLIIYSPPSHAEPDFTKCDMFQKIVINQSDLKNKFISLCEV